jgi:hypothetical protein
MVLLHNYGYGYGYEELADLEKCWAFNNELKFHILKHNDFGAFAPVLHGSGTLGVGFSVQLLASIPNWAFFNNQSYPYVYVQELPLAA